MSASLGPRFYERVKREGKQFPAERSPFGHGPTSARGNFVSRYKAGRWIRRDGRSSEFRRQTATRLSRRGGPQTPKLKSKREEFGQHTNPP